MAKNTLEVNLDYGLPATLLFMRKEAVAVQDGQAATAIVASLACLAVIAGGFLQFDGVGGRCGSAFGAGCVRWVGRGRCRPRR
jgi:hypothetical protein